MEEATTSLLQRVIDEIPNFANNLLALLTGPKTFLSQKHLADKRALTGALTFFVLCALISSCIFEVPFLPKDANLSIFVAKALVFTLCACIFTTISFRVAWGCVGGKAHIRAYFAVALYLSGLLGIIGSFATLASKGVVHVYARDQLQPFISAMNNLLVVNKPAFFIWYNNIAGSDLQTITTAYVIWFLGVPVAYWVYIWLTWGTFRALNGLSRWRSAIAFLLWYVFAIPLAYVVVFGARALDLTLF